MRTVQPMDAWTAYFAVLTEALSAAPVREPRRETAQRAPIQQVASTPPVARRTLVERLDHWFWRQRQAARERELARSLDIHELESRMRALDRPGSNLF